MRRIHHGTGKFLSEAFIIASIKPQSEERLFIELRVQYGTGKFLSESLILA